MSKVKKLITDDNPSLIIDNKHIDYNDLTKDQKKAADAFDDWFYSRKRKTKDMVFRIGGVGGAGKSYLIKYLIQAHKLNQGNCLVVSYTGQAVNVLRRSGIIAKTIHSTFYHVVDKILMKNGKPVMYHGIPVMVPKFVPVKKLDSNIKLIICDEASFLSKSLEDHMLSYNVPILETGDPIQLPPVAGEQCFYMDNLDIFMTQIMRQNEGSEIIRLANQIRKYEPIDPKEYGKDVKFLWSQKTLEETFFRFRPFFKGADMILTLKNKDRSILTNLYREHILQTTSPYPRKGEKLICRRNDWNLTLGPYPLTNGTQGIAVNSVGMSEVDPSTRSYILDFQPTFLNDDYFDGLICDSDFLRRDYGDKTAEKLSSYNPAHKFEFGWCLSVHSAQGSQASKVLFLDTPIRDEEYHMRVRYTAVTRAVDTLYYVLKSYEDYPGWTDLWKNARC